MDNPISIIIHTRNEEKNIKGCLSSAHLLSHKILVVDMESTDSTVDIAKEKGVSVYSFPYSFYVEPAREFGISKAYADWVLILDADERITEKLAAEIKNVVSKTDHSYYKIPRKNIFSRVKWLKYGGWWPDYQIRLVNKKYLKIWPKEIHSTPEIGGKLGYLINPLTHYFHGDIEKMVEKTVIFENIESDLLYRAGRPADTLIFFRKFLGELWRRLGKGLGFMDGNVGIIEGIYQAFSKTITYLYLYEKKNRPL
jgi:glycosyltransferase involved in cell wall biosynthesis